MITGRKWVRGAVVMLLGSSVGMALAAARVDPDGLAPTADPVPGFVSITNGDYNANATWDVDDNPGGQDSSDVALIQPGHTVTITTEGDASNDTVIVSSEATLAADRDFANQAFRGATITLNGGTLAYRASYYSFPRGHLVVQADSILKVWSGAGFEYYAEFGSLTFAEGTGDGFVLSAVRGDANTPNNPVFVDPCVLPHSGVISNDVPLALNALTLDASATLTKTGPNRLEIGSASTINGAIAFLDGRLDFYSPNGLRSGALTVPVDGVLVGRRLDTMFSWNGGANQPTITLSEGSELLFLTQGYDRTAGGNLVVAGDVLIDSFSYGNASKFVAYNSLAFSVDNPVVRFRQSGTDTNPQTTRFDAGTAVDRHVIMDVEDATAHVDLGAVSFTAGKTLTKRGIGPLHLANPVSGAGVLAVEAGSVTTAGSLSTLDALTFDIRGTTPGSDFGQVVLADLALNGPRLDVITSGPIASNDVFVLITRTSGTVSLNDLNGNPIADGSVFLTSDGSQWTLSYQGGDGNDVAVTFVTDDPLPLVTVDGSFTALDKFFDGTTAATIETNALTLEGVEQGDDVTLNPVANFADAAPGTNKLVSLSSASSLGGADAGKYLLSLSGAPTTTATINRVPVTYYVRTNGLDAANGLTPEANGTNGPMLTVVQAYTTAINGDTVDIGPGVFELAQSPAYGLELTNRVHLLGTGSDTTRLTSTNATAGILRLFGPSGGPDASNRTTISGMTLDPVNSGSYGIVIEEHVDHVRFDDVDFRPTEFAWRMRAIQPPGYWMSDFYLKNFDLSGGKFWIKTSSDNTMPFQIRNWTLDGGVWDNASWNSFYRTPSLAIDGLTVKGGFVFRNNTFAFFDTSPHIANLVFDGVGGVAGPIRLEEATFMDNTGAGVDLRNLYSGVSVVVSNCTFVETGDGLTQSLGILSSVEPAVILGAIRAIGGTWSNLQAAIVIEDNGGQQDAPIELKDIHFGNCATGLVISGWAANLWYVCPDLSGATIDAGGVLVSGGRQTCYGDINLDGVVDMLDSVLARQYYPMASNATWTTGDFDFDGDFDEHDLAWLPPFTGSMLIVR